MRSEIVQDLYADINKVKPVKGELFFSSVYYIFNILKTLSCPPPISYNRK